MKNYFIIILLLFSLNACTHRVEDQTIYNKLTGNWSTDSISVGIIHGFIKSSLTDSLSFPLHSINTHFSIHFKEDKSFVFNNKNGPIETGMYNMINKSLTLTLNKASQSWLTFDIDSITDDNLFLTSRYIPFYSTHVDSISIFRGENVNLILKRK